MRALVIATVVAQLGACGGESSKAQDTAAADTAMVDVAGEDASDGADGATPEDSVAPDTTPPLAPWQHEGPIAPGIGVVPTPPYFLEVSAATGVTAFGRSEGRAMVVDLDGDGRDDLVTLPVTLAEGERMTPRMFRSAGPNAEGQVQYVEHTDPGGLSDAVAVSMAFGDLDNDGDQDVVTGLGFRAAGGKLGAWLNDGAGHFVYAGLGGLRSPILGKDGGADIYKEVAAIALADFDRDGLLDLYLGHWYSGAVGVDGQYLPPDDELYRGDGAGGFAPVVLPDQTNPLTLEVAPSYTNVARAAYGLALADYDDDGDLDLFVNNYGAGRPAMDSPPRYFDHNFLWRNDGGQVFTDVGAAEKVAATTRGIGGVQKETPVVMDGVTFPGPIGGNGFGCQWGDLDNDGDLDLAVGTIAHPDYPQADRTLLHYNQGPGISPRFTEESAARGLEYYEDELHPALVDVDQDGRLDFAMSRLRGGSKFEFYLQGQDQSFHKATWAESGVDIARPGPTVWLDYDGDGDLDFFMPQGGGRLFENAIGQANRGLALTLVATTPRDATGARVTLRTSIGPQIREVVGGHGHYNTAWTRTVHFGLGRDSGASDVTIRWPNGEVQVLGAVKADLKLRVTQGGAVEIL